MSGFVSTSRPVSVSRWWAPPRGVDVPAWLAACAEVEAVSPDLGGHHPPERISPPNSGVPPHGWFLLADGSLHRAPPAPPPPPQGVGTGAVCGNTTRPMSIGTPYQRVVVWVDGEPIESVLIQDAVRS